MPTYNDFGTNQLVREGYQHPIQHIPSNSFSDGIAPAGTFIVAPYLPLLRYNEDKFVYTVISSGKIIALDSNGNVVPAGLRLEAAAYAVALGTSVAAADTQALVRYTATDVANGVRNFAGTLVVENEPVVKSFFTGATLVNTISYYIGVAQYDIFAHAGGTDNLDPTKIKYVNFNRQPSIAPLCDYHMQYPVVKDVATIRTAPLKGIAGLVSTRVNVKLGAFVTYDRESNFIIAQPGDYGFGTTPVEAIVGQVTGLKVFKDEDTGAKVGDHNFLDKVVAPNAATASVLNQVPNSQNDGMGTYITYSNGYAVVQFGLHFR